MDDEVPERRQSEKCYCARDDTPRLCEAYRGECDTDVAGDEIWVISVPPARKNGVETPQLTQEEDADGDTICWQSAAGGLLGTWTCSERRQTLRHA